MIDDILDGFINTDDDDDETPDAEDDIEGPYVGDYLNEKYNDVPKAKKVKTPPVEYGPGKHPVTQKALSVLKKLEKVVAAELSKPPQPFPVESPYQFITDAAQADELIRLATGVWCAAKHVDFADGPLVVIGLLWLIEVKHKEDEYPFFEVLDFAHLEILKRHQIMTDIVKRIGEPELPAFLRTLPSAIKTRVQDRGKAEIRLLLL